MSYTTVNPATGGKLESYDYATDKSLEQTLARAIEGFSEWRRTDMERRRNLLNGVANVLREDKVSCARQMVREMGKPIAQARSEVEKCAWVCEYFAENGESFLEPREVETDADESMVAYEPLGPILAIMPWNFPFWQVFRFAAPNLMAGNVGILKHSPNVQGCARKIVDIFRRAGLPEEAFQNIFVEDDVTADVIHDSRIRGVTLTGSVGAGRAVASEAGAALKPTVLELGGSDPLVVLEDCDLEEAVEGAVRARTLNSGQSCIAAKRFIVEDSIHSAFVRRLEEKLADMKVGPPVEESTELGPMAREDLRDNLHRQVVESIEAGATCQLGGEIDEKTEGFFYPVTMLTDVEPGMPAFEEETFGPVASVTKASDVDVAIELANQTRYGLGASIWTTRGRGRRLVDRLEAGHVAVNGIVKSDPRLPFGGIRDSGYGRELSREGILEFVNKKTVWIG
jgi:succinate-semialdehyde dehydrogenase/glutarate-semialdehyde dehydrogenase